MSSRITRISAALLLGASALSAATATASTATPARTKAAGVYQGKTRSGDPISLRLAGSRVTHLVAYVPTLCLATTGLPISGTDPFDPSGSFRLGRTDKATAKRPNAMYNTADVTKNFFVTTHRDRSAAHHGEAPRRLLVPTAPLHLPDQRQAVRLHRRHDVQAGGPEVS